MEVFSLAVLKGTRAFRFECCCLPRDTAPLNHKAGKVAFSYRTENDEVVLISPKYLLHMF